MRVVWPVPFFSERKNDVDSHVSLLKKKNWQTVRFFPLIVRMQNFKEEVLELSKVKRISPSSREKIYIHYFLLEPVSNFPSQQNKKYILRRSILQNGNFICHLFILHIIFFCRIMEIFCTFFKTRHLHQKQMTRLPNQNKKKCNELREKPFVN